MSYNAFERRIAQFLDSSPKLRAFLKRAYQRANHAVRPRRGSAAALHGSATIARVGGAGAAETFFGYFGLSPWSADGGKYLFHRWNGGERVEVCVADSRSGTVETIGTTVAWTFQQGSMAQWWQDGAARYVLFNDVVDRRLVCRIAGEDRSERQVPWPLQALHPSAGRALSLNYRRLGRIQPEYGYDVDAENFLPEGPLDRDGLWSVDLRSGEARLIISLQRLRDFEPVADMEGAAHKVNHALHSPSGRRFVFMHRWVERRGKHSRLYCASEEGGDLRLLLDDRMVSHYAWQDDDTLLVWARTAQAGDHYYLIDVASGTWHICGAGILDRLGDGHPSFSPDGRWIVTDSYPDRSRMRHLMLFRPADETLVEIGSFLSPWRYDGPRRCDLHPRWSPDGRKISIDSSHEGVRANYVIDVGRVLENRESGAVRAAHADG